MEIEKEAIRHHPSTKLLVSTERGIGKGFWHRGNHSLGNMLWGK